MPIVWKNCWNTEFDEIDMQHKSIAAHINKLRQAIPCTDSPSVTVNEHDADEYAHYASLFGSLSTGEFGYVLSQLIECLESHFIYEESLQITTKYDLAEAHKASHDSFLIRLKMYQAKYQAGEDVAAKLHRVLRQWVELHISNDIQFVTTIKNNLQQTVADQKIETPDNKGRWFARLLANKSRPKR
jgi:hemerythrin